jgi:autoinducer 2 (AI-2) kinase
MNYLLAIDAGTGSVRAVLFDTNGAQIAFANREWSHESKEGVPFSMGFDWIQNWELIKACIQEVLAKTGVNPELILGISATSMREGIVLYDKDGNEIWAVANVDARAGDEVKELHKMGLEEDFYAKSGQTFALGAMPRILWLKNNRPQIYDKVAHISMLSDWVLYKLCGVIASEPSNAGTSGIFSLKSRSWDKDMMKKVGLKSDIFPPCQETGTVLGHITPQIATQTSLHVKTKVILGGGDVQLGCAGLGVVNKGDAAVLGGSFWQQVVNIDSSTLPPQNMEIRINPHVIHGQSQAEGITFFSGLVMRWFRDTFCQEEIAKASQNGEDVYALLERQAMEVPVGSNGILPIFSDTMKYGRWYHASPSFLNLSLDSTLCNKASMFRSLQENACIVSQLNLAKIEAFTGLTCKAIVFAGGASKGTLWPQMLSDVMGLHVKIPKVTEATALGAAMAAAVGCGIFQNLQEAASSWVVWEREFSPNMQNHHAYKTIQKRWQKAYAKQVELVDEGITTSMWKAPGL